MGDEKLPIMGGGIVERDRNREQLIPAVEDPAEDSDSKASYSNSGSSLHHNPGREVSSCPLPVFYPENYPIFQHVRF